jgi:hypothetical protein
MAPDGSIFQLLYVSQLAPARDFSVMREIAVVSRLRNPSCGLTGALLFDGARFAQLLEGARVEVLALMRNIAADTRHVGIRVLWVSLSAVQRARSRWATGYCNLSDLDVLDGPEALRGASALDAFLTLVENTDLE